MANDDLTKGVCSCGESTVADQILEYCSKIWDGFHSHPFVLGIANGTLDKEKFKYFMIQDYLYLLDYAKVFSIGTAKARNPEVLKAFSAYVDQIMDGELDIHRGYMKRLGIRQEEAEGAEMALDNLSYTSYMIREAYEGGPAEICAAILPCAVSYEVIAKKMVEDDQACVEHPFYGEWIRGYADPGYHAANEELKALTNLLTKDYSPAQIEYLLKIGERCSRYEGAFWDMSWELRP